MKKKMSHKSLDNVCVIIEDADLADDEPGPSRSVLRPSACAYEASWFSQPFLRPSDQVINSDIPPESLSTFKELIWNKPHDRMVPGYGLTPKELASVSSDGRKGWLVTSHFYWLSRCLNQQQRHTRFFVLDPDIRKAALEKLLSGKSCQEVEQMIFVLSVGRQDNGIVFLGTDKMPGDHWSVAVVNIITGTVTYCDTLGWPAPENFLPSLIKYTNFFGLSQTSQLSVRLAHKPNVEQHACTPQCTNYPLQTCSDVCGVTAIVCIAIAALDRNLFELLLTPLNKDFKLYLTDPTQYSSYLRHVLIHWLVKDHIDISRISLKTGFNPLDSSVKHTPNLKRKLDGECNGDSPKHRMKNIASNKNNITINDYILEALATGISSENLLAEVVSLFGGKDGQAGTAEKLLTNFICTSAVERSKDDAISIKSYVKDFIAFPDKNPVILFKNQGKEMLTLNQDDAVLAIQTSFQKEMMKIYGKTCVCVDTSRKREGDRFFLVTVLISYEGFYELPVAWLISNRCDGQVLNLFFKALKIRVGELHTKVFMGDLNFSAYKIWIQHFPKPGKKMFIPWEVLQAWSKKMESFNLGGKEQSQISSLLNILLTITDTKAFKGYLRAIMEFLKPFQPFLSYFKAKFVEESKDEAWASCYRQIPSKHVPFLKPFARLMKEQGLSGGSQNMDRTDILMHKLLQLIRFLENKLHIQANQSRLEHTLRDIERQHEKLAGNLDIFQSASGEEWHVRASSETESFSIIDSGNVDCDCEMRCKSCKMCVHRYICSCTDYLLSASSCKHVHFVSTYRKMNSVIGDSASSSMHAGGAEADVADTDSDKDAGKLQAEALKELKRLSQTIPHIKDRRTLEDICHMVRNCVQH